jgi:hypothetical protein
VRLMSDMHCCLRCGVAAPGPRLLPSLSCQAWFTAGRRLGHADMNVACVAVLQRLGHACHPVSAAKHDVQADGGLLTMLQECWGMRAEALSSTQLPVTASISTTIVSTLHRHRSAVDTTNACGQCVARPSSCRRLQQSLQEQVPPLQHQRQKQRKSPLHHQQQRVTGPPP